tara:strand:+ start:2646 stop:2843 length:198 start_codon:yes stop_codon:yes gene_type:complete
MKKKTKTMVLKNHKEEQRADKVADKLSSELFASNDIGVMQANSVYLDVKKIVLDAIIRTNKLRTK